MRPERFNGRRVFVTGATGMVGSALTASLANAGAEVTALVRDVDPRSEFYRAGTERLVKVVHGRLEDIRALERALAENGIEYVFHLGAQTQVLAALRAPLDTFESNVRGTYCLLEACRRQREELIGVVVASSDKAYGRLSGSQYTEGDPLAGEHPYDVSKSCTDLISRTYWNTYGLPVAVSRCGNIYGAGDLNWDRIVPGVIRWALRDERPILRSDGQFIRDYIYLDDVVSGYLALAEQIADPRVAGEAFNFSTESRVTVLEVVELILDLTGKSHLEPDIRNTASAEIREQTLDAAKARRTLGWRAEYDLRGGLGRTISWYESYLASRPG